MVFLCGAAASAMNGQALAVGGGGGDLNQVSGVVLDAETKVGEGPHKRELRLWLRLLTCANLVEGMVRTRLRAEFGVTLPRFDLMAQLERAPEGMTLGALSRRMMVSNGNVTGLVERLVALGQVERARDPRDGRVAGGAVDGGGAGGVRGDGAGA